MPAADAMIWDLWKQGFAAWEQATARHLEQVPTNPGVRGPAGALLAQRAQ